MPRVPHTSDKIPSEEHTSQKTATKNGSTDEIRSDEVITEDHPRENSSPDKGHSDQRTQGNRSTDSGSRDKLTFAKGAEDKPRLAQWQSTMHSKIRQLRQLPRRPETSHPLGDPPWETRHFWWVLIGGWVGLFIGVFLVAILNQGENFNDEVLLILLASQYGGHLSVFLLLTRFRGLSIEKLGFDLRPQDGHYLVVGMVIQVVTLLLLAPLAFLLDLNDSPQALTEQLKESSGTTIRILLFLVVVLMGPVMEELMFRGILLRTLVLNPRFRIRYAMLTSAVIFAGLHLIGGTNGPFWKSALLIFLQLTMVGLALAWISLRHTRLGPVIFTHSGYNLVATLVLFWPPGG